MQKHSLTRFSIINPDARERFTATLHGLSGPTNGEWRSLLTDVCPEGHGVENRREWKVAFMGQIV